MGLRVAWSSLSRSSLIYGNGRDHGVAQPTWATVNSGKCALASRKSSGHSARRSAYISRHCDGSPIVLCAGLNGVAHAVRTTILCCRRDTNGNPKPQTLRRQCQLTGSGRSNGRRLANVSGTNEPKGCCGAMEREGRLRKERLPGPGLAEIGDREQRLLLAGDIVMLDASDRS